MPTTTLLTDLISWYVGIDISKAWLDCWLRPDGQYMRCDNNHSGFVQLHRWLSEQEIDPEQTVLCMEHTGPYGNRLLAAMSGYGWKCAIEKTTITEKVRPDHHRKDDRFDARLIAEYADRFSDKLHLQKPAEDELEMLSRLYTERSRIIRQRTSTKTKQTQSEQYTTDHPLLKQHWRQQIDLYNRQIDNIEHRIRQIVDSHEGLATYCRLMRSIPGVGKVTAWLWLRLFYGQTSLDPKKIASRFGFAPHSNRSGSSKKGKTRSAGHGVAEMRDKMSNAVRSSSTHSSKFKQYKEKKKDEGKCWPIIRNNLINKLIKIMCAIWNSGNPYDPGHTSRFDRQKQAA